MQGNHFYDQSNQISVAEPNLKMPINKVNNTEINGFNKKKKQENCISGA